MTAFSRWMWAHNSLRGRVLNAQKVCEAGTNCLSISQTANFHLAIAADHLRSAAIALKTRDDRLAPSREEP